MDSAVTMVADINIWNRYRLPLYSHLSFNLPFLVLPCSIINLLSLSASSSTSTPPPICPSIRVCVIFYSIPL